MAADEREILIRVDERTAAMAGKLDDHIEACRALYATKAELGAAQSRPLVWLVTVGLAGGVVAYGKGAASAVVALFTGK